MKIKSKSLKIKFNSNLASKFFIHHCEYFLKDFDYIISSTVDEFDIQIRGEFEKIRAASSKLRKFAIEVNNAFLLSSNGMYKVGSMVIERAVSGVLNLSFLCTALNLMGFDASVEDDVVLTNAPLEDLVDTNNRLFKILQSTSPLYNLDVRKFVSLLILKHGGDEAQVVEHCIRNGYLHNSKSSPSTLHLSKSLPSLLGAALKSYCSTELPVSPDSQIHGSFFDGGEIVIVKKENDMS